MSGPRFEPWVWAVVVILASFLLATISEVASVLWRAWRNQDKPGPPPYDWKQDDGLLNVWAKEEEGEVLAVGPLLQWRYK
jgi:hypothetical protein